MNDNQTRLIFLIFLGIAAALFLLFAFLKQKLNDSEPIFETKAEVLSKKVVTQSHRSTYGRVNGHYYYVTFRCANGDVLELPAPEGSGAIPEGQTGILTWQGKKMDQFIPYE